MGQVSEEMARQFSPIPAARGYPEAKPPKQLRSMPVLMMPGLSGTAAMPGGNSCASACVRPSIAHFVAQYGATSAAVERPQPEMKLTMTPLLFFTIAGTKWRMTFAMPLRFTSTTSENSVALNFPERRVSVDDPGVVQQQIRRGVGFQDAFGPRGSCPSPATSTATKPWGAPNCFCNCAISFSERPQPSTVWPNRINSSAIARPSPRATPVMRMVFPLPA